MLSAADRINLLYIALKCPHTSGLCVYSARSLYNIYTATNNLQVYPFYDDCNATGLYKKESDNLKTNLTFSAEIYPNNNNGKFYIDCNIKDNYNVTITITDMLGKILETKQIEIYNGLGYIDANVVAGSYILHIQKSETEAVNKKLLIIK